MEPTYTRPITELAEALHLLIAKPSGIEGEPEGRWVRRSEITRRVLTHTYVRRIMASEFVPVIRDMGIESRTYVDTHGNHQETQYLIVFLPVAEPNESTAR
jgi:hypothetical protein